MSIESFHALVEERCKEKKISPRKASIEAVDNADFIRKLKTAKNAPKADKLAALAKVLSISYEEITKHLPEIGGFFGDAVPYQPDSVERVQVVGSVQAGVFTEALEWEDSRKYSIQIPINDGYSPDLKRYALEVKGESMNKVFPAGSLVTVIDFDEMGGRPQTGDYVTVYRRDAHGPGFEATVKALQIRDDGSYCLWPKSTDPSFQQPLVIPPPSEERQDTAGALDVEIKALVVGSIKCRPKATF